MQPWTGDMAAISLVRKVMSLESALALDHSLMTTYSKSSHCLILRIMCCNILASYGELLNANIPERYVWSLDRTKVWFGAIATVS
jgi:hypothetical protein